jgi:thioredoxin-dependent peroxiredoxin
MASVDVGDRAPEFELAGTGGRTYRLAEYRGREGVLLAFYPGDFTRVCTKQFCSYRDNADRLDGLGVPVLGISPQSVDSHERWISEQQLNVPLLADEDLAVAKAYGAVGWGSPLVRLAGMPATPGGNFVRRSIFVVDGEGIVRYRHVSRAGATFQSVDDLEAAVGTLRG